MFNLNVFYLLLAAGTPPAFSALRTARNMASWYACAAYAPTIFWSISTSPDERAKTVSPSNMVKATRHGIANHIPGDEEIGRKSHLADYLHLVPDAVTGLHIVLTIAILKSVEG